MDATTILRLEQRLLRPDPEHRRRHRAAGTGVDYAEGIKLTGPRRMAVYFTKYGTLDAGGVGPDDRAARARTQPRVSEAGACGYIKTTRNLFGPPEMFSPR
ncbi:MAG: hypothetical protein ACRDRZ_15785 [Pseudonocardiaceae bacterium]